jgi:hypothetical protein
VLTAVFGTSWLKALPGMARHSADRNGRRPRVGFDVITSLMGARAVRVSIAPRKPSTAAPFIANTEGVQLDGTEESTDVSGSPVAPGNEGILVVQVDEGGVIRSEQHVGIG